jgi:hypothetical protein
VTGKPSKLARTVALQSLDAETALELAHKPELGLERSVWLREVIELLYRGGYSSAASFLQAQARPVKTQDSKA